MRRLIKDDSVVIMTLHKEKMGC